MDMGKRIGIAFEGGGGKGAYQIGVWQALHEFGLDKNNQIVAVSGTSIGAMNAFLFAYGNFELAKSIWLSLTPSQVFSNPEKNFLPWNLDGGIFSREGVLKIFDDFKLDFNRVNMDNPISCYATCLRVANADDREKIERFFNGLIAGGLILSQVVNPFVSGSLLQLLKHSISPIYSAVGNILGIKDIRYFKINEFVESIKKDILLASSAIPVVFPEHPIEGSYYIDGGLGDNLPVEPLFKYEKCDLVFLVHCNRDTVLPEKYEKKVIDIVPLETQFGLSGTFDFSKEGIERRINQGYYDTIQKINDVLPIIDSTFRIINAKEKFNKMLEESYKREDIFSRRKRVGGKNSMDEKYLEVIKNNYKENYPRHSSKTKDMPKLMLKFSFLYSANKARLNEIKKESGVQKFLSVLTGGNKAMLEEILTNDDKLKEVVKEVISIMWEEQAITREDMCRLLERVEDYHKEFVEMFLCHDREIKALEKAEKLRKWRDALDNKAFTGEYDTEYKGQHITKIPSFMLKFSFIIREFYHITDGKFDKNDLILLEKVLSKIFDNDILIKKSTFNEVFEELNIYAKEIFDLFREKIAIDLALLDRIPYRPPYFTILIQMAKNNEKEKERLLPQVYGQRLFENKDLAYDFLLGLKFVDANLDADGKYAKAIEFVKEDRVEDACILFWQLINSKEYFDKANAYLGLFFHEILSVKKSLSLSKLGKNITLDSESEKDIDLAVIEMLKRGMEHSTTCKYCRALYSLWYDNNTAWEPDDSNLESSDDILECYINGLYYESIKNKSSLTKKEKKKAEKMAKKWYSKIKDNFKLAFIKYYHDSSNINKNLIYCKSKLKYGDLNLKIMLYTR